MLMNQGRNDGWARGYNSPGAESLRVRRKVPTMSQALSSIRNICLRETSGSHKCVPNLLLAPGTISPRCARVINESQCVHVEVKVDRPLLVFGTSIRPKVRCSVTGIRGGY